MLNENSFNLLVESMNELNIQNFIDFMGEIVDPKFEVIDVSAGVDTRIAIMAIFHITNDGIRSIPTNDLNKMCAKLENEIKEEYVLADILPEYGAEGLPKKFTPYDDISVTYTGCFIDEDKLLLNFEIEYSDKEIEHSDDEEISYAYNHDGGLDDIW